MCIRDSCEPLSYGLDINKGTHAKLQGFRELIEGFIVDQADKNACLLYTSRCV